MDNLQDVIIVDLASDRGLRYLAATPEKSNHKKIKMDGINY
jgi:hypothetical protein